MSHEIPERWKGRLREHMLASTGEKREHLLATDFRTDSNVSLRFRDGSFCLFRYAFYLLDQESGEVAVFTEHCGYHFFPADDLELERLQSIWDEHP
ncbi:MAG: hypothetical protein LC800_09165 [Acidobacteria bacterium]|nr:hypothetical protein [Acidobacteriota bacterium]